MSTDKTLADVQPGGRVRLGDQLPEAVAQALATVNEAANDARHAGNYKVANALVTARVTLSKQLLALSAQPSPVGQDARAQFEEYRGGDCERDAQGYYVNPRTAQDWAMWQAALSTRQPVPETDAYQLGFRDGQDRTCTVVARQPVGVSTDTLRALADRWASDRGYTGSPVDEIRALIDEPTAARQPVGEPVTDAGRSAAYDAIDRFLRNNMDDEAYAAYVEHLEALWAAIPAQAVDLGLHLDRYDAGLLGNGGGGDVNWWQDYIRAELDRAHEFYQDQADSQAVGK